MLSTRFSWTSTRSFERAATRLLGTALVGVLTVLPGRAQVPRSGGGGASQQMMQQYQQLAAETTQLKAQLAQMQKDLDGTKSELAAAKKERDALKGRGAEAAGAVARANAGKATAEQATEQTKKQLIELVSKFREIAVSLRQSEADKATLQKQLAEGNSAYDKCTLANLDLFDIANQVLDRYEHVGFFTKAGATEPFTQITRARIHNLVDDYRERAQALRIKKGAKSSPDAPAASASH